MIGVIITIVLVLLMLFCSLVFPRAGFEGGDEEGCRGGRRLSLVKAILCIHIGEVCIYAPLHNWVALFEYLHWMHRLLQSYKSLAAN